MDETMINDVAEMQESFVETEETKVENYEGSEGNEACNDAADESTNALVGKVILGGGAVLIGAGIAYGVRKKDKIKAYLAEKKEDRAKVKALKKELKEARKQAKEQAKNPDPPEENDTEANPEPTEEKTE